MEIEVLNKQAERVALYMDTLNDVRENGVDKLASMLLAMHDDAVADGEKESDLAVAALLLMELQGCDNECEIYFDTEDEE